VLADGGACREERLLAQARKAEAKREAEKQRKLDQKFKVADAKRAETLAEVASKSQFKNVQYVDDDEDDYE